MHDEAHPGTEEAASLSRFRWQRQPDREFPVEGALDRRSVYPRPLERVPLVEPA